MCRTYDYKHFDIIGRDTHKCKQDTFKKDAEMVRQGYTRAWTDVSSGHIHLVYRKRSYARSIMLVAISIKGECNGTVN